MKRSYLYLGLSDPPTRNRWCACPVSLVPGTLLSLTFLIYPECQSQTSIVSHHGLTSFPIVHTGQEVLRAGEVSSSLTRQHLIGLTKPLSSLDILPVPQGLRGWCLRQSHVCHSILGEVARGRSLEIVVQTALLNRQAKVQCETLSQKIRAGRKAPCVRL